MGDCEVEATLKNIATGDKTKKKIYACYSCGIMFVEADMTEEQMKAKQDLVNLDPFKH